MLCKLLVKFRNNLCGAVPKIVKKFVEILFAPNCRADWMTVAMMSSPGEKKNRIYHL